MGTKKYYVVWEGKKTGVFSSWDTVKKLVQGYEGAKYKSFGELLFRPLLLALLALA